MLGDAGEDVSEPSLRIDVVELGGADQTVHDGGALTAAVGGGTRLVHPQQAVLTVRRARNARPRGARGPCPDASAAGPNLVEPVNPNLAAPSMAPAERRGYRDGRFRLPPAKPRGPEPTKIERRSRMRVVGTLRRDHREDGLGRSRERRTEPGGRRPSAEHRIAGMTSIAPRAYNRWSAGSRGSA